MNNKCNDADCNYPKCTCWDKKFYRERYITELESRLHEIKEIYIGSEGGEPETCAEAYWKRLCEQQYKIACGEDQ